MKITAFSLRWIFLASITLLIGLSSFGFYLTYQKLASYNQETMSKNTEATETDETIKQIETAIAYIEDNRDDIDKAKSITANAENYQYQDLIIADIRNIASASHLVVDSISFSGGGQGGEAGGGGTAAPAPEAASPGTAGAPQAAATVPGATKETATVTFSPQPNTKLYYQYILDFLYKIQQNKTKFYTADISLTASGKDNETVDLKTLTIDVYVKGTN